MSRHGYVDDPEQPYYGMWRGQVASAIRGKRGQAMLRQLRDSLDAMPDKRLVTGVLKDKEGCVCTTGAILDAKGISGLEDNEGNDHRWIAETLNVSECLIQEIEFENDEGGWRETPEQRWVRMRAWVEKHIHKVEAGEGRER